MTAAREGPNHNPLYDTFVDVPETDWLQGLVAYGLYKRAKQEWASEHFARENRPPNDGELRAYIRTWTPSQVEGKRAEAANALAEYANEVVESARPQILKEALRGSVGRALWLGILTNFVYTLLLISIVILLKWAGIDLLALLEKASPPK
jgi:hypothetical protein